MKPTLKTILIVLGVPFLLVLFWYLLATVEADARDLGQWKDADPKIAEWYRSLMQPDKPTIPCCGESDAYYADKVRVDGTRVFATVTDERPDEPLKRPHIPVGTEFEIPPHKLKWDRGNPVGHNILFVGAGGVYCFVQGTLI